MTPEKKHDIVGLGSLYHHSVSFGVGLGEVNGGGALRYLF